MEFLGKAIVSATFGQIHSMIGSNADNGVQHKKRDKFISQVS